MYPGPEAAVVIWLVLHPGYPGLGMTVPPCQLMQ